MPAPLDPFAARPGQPAADRVICASRATSAEAPFEQLLRIRESALRHNVPHGVRVVLFYQSGWFLYWLEGAAAAVQNTLARVQRDPRHQAPVVVHHSRGRHFLFSVWSMGLLPSTESHEAFGARVDALLAIRKAGSQYAPTSVVRRLSAPFGISINEALGDADAFHRVGVCSADGNDAFSLVRWVGSQLHHDVLSRRIAGEGGPDIASDFVDLSVNGAPVRLVAMARNGLWQGINRTFMVDWPHLLLLFSGEPRRDTALMRLVLHACEDLPVKPLMLGVAPLTAVHEAMAAMAASGGAHYRALGEIDSNRWPVVWELLRGLLGRTPLPPTTVWPVISPPITI